MACHDTCNPNSTPSKVMLINMGSLTSPDKMNR